MDKQRWSKGGRELVIDMSGPQPGAGEKVVPLSVVTEFLAWDGWREEWHMKTKDAN